MAKLRQIFMTAGDMTRWFAAAEQKLGWKVKFVPYDLFDGPQPEVANCLDIPSFGVSASGDQRHNRHYFIVPETATIVQEPFRLNDGQTRYSVLPDENTGMVGFDPSGVCAPTHIVTGEFDTALTDEVSATLYKALSHVLRQQCTISGTAAVGAEALELHRAGVPAERPLDGPPVQRPRDSRGGETRGSRGPRQPERLETPNQGLKLTGAAIPVSRGMKVLPAAPAV